MVEYNKIDDGKDIDVTGNGPYSLSISIEGYNFEVDDLYTQEIGADTDMVTITISGKNDGIAFGSMGITISGDETWILHMEVPEDRRGWGAGRVMFNIALEVAKWNGSDEIGGNIGGGDETKQFLIAMGVPEKDIEVKENKNMTDSAEFKTKI